MTNPSDSLYDQTRQAWEDIWDGASPDLELEALKEQRVKDQFDVFPRYLSKQGVILEAGSGLGATVIHLRNQGFNMIGLDYAENALKAARRYDPSLVQHVGDVHALPYAANSLHGYLSFGVLEHFEHGPGPALREANRVLVPGGILVLTIPYPNLIHKLVHWKRRVLRQSQLTNDQFYESTYTQHQLKAELEQAGFEVLVVKPTSHAFTLWGLGGPFRAQGYYRTTRLADNLGAVLRVVAPWSFNFTTMLIGRKARHLGA